MIDWRDSAVHQRRKEYRETMLSIQDSAAQVKSWTDELRKAERNSASAGSAMGGVMGTDGIRAGGSGSLTARTRRMLNRRTEPARLGVHST